MKNNNIRKSVKKTALAALAAAPLAVAPSVWALPADQAALNAFVQSKSAGVTVTSVNSALVTVDSTVDASVVSWTEFGSAGNAIGAGDTVKFNLPTATAGILNRVIGANPTTIAGKIDSNGKVYVLNANGITVASSAVINVGGLGLSTVPESEGYFLLNKDLSYIGTATNDVQLNGATIVTIGNTGNVALAGRKVLEAAGDIKGNLFLKGLGASAVNGDVLIAQSAALTVSGNLDVNSTAGLTSGTVTFGNGSNFATTVKGTSLNVVAKAAAGAYAVVTAGTGGVIANTVGSKATFDAKGGNVNVASTGNNFVTVSVLNAGDVSIRDLDNSEVKLDNTATTNANSALAIDTLSATNLTVLSGTGAALTQSGALTLSGDLTAVATNQRILLTNAANTIAGNVTLNALGATNTATQDTIVLAATGNLKLASLNATTTSNNKINISTTGDITQSAALSNTATNAVLRLTTTGAGKITLDTAANDFTGINITSGTGDVVVADANGINLVGMATGGKVTINGSRTAAGTVEFKKVVNTNAASSLTINNNDGAVTSSTGGAGDHDKTWAGALNVNTQGAAGTVSINQFTGGLGTVSVNTTDDTTVAGTYAAGSNISFGNANTVNIDLGITKSGTAGNLEVRTVGGNITDSGTLTIGGTTTLQAGDVDGGSGAEVYKDITLDSVDNSFTGQINGTKRVDYFADGRILVNNLTLVAKDTITIGSDWANGAEDAAKIRGNVSITVANAATVGAFEDIIVSGPINVGGITTLTAEGGITATSNNNLFGGVVNVTAGESVSVVARKGLTVKTVSLKAADALVANTASFNARNGNLVIGAAGGAYTSDFSGATTFTTVNTEEKTITDNVDGIDIKGDVSFQTKGGAITINNAGNSFGKLTISTNNATTKNASASVRENLTLHINSVDTGKGNVTLTSDMGDVVQTLLSGGSIVTDSDAALNGTNRGTDSFVAKNGAVVLFNPNAGNAVKGLISVDAKSNATTLPDTVTAGTLYTAAAQKLTGVVQAGTITLGDVRVSSGGFVATTSDTTVDALTLSAGKSVYVTGEGKFTTAAGGTINLDQANNNFGALTLDTAGAGTVNVQELLTVNLKKVNTGSLTATSQMGNVMDSGTGADAVVATTGVLSALGGTSTVVLDVVANNIGTLTIKSGGDAYLNDATGGVVIGDQTAIGGNLTVRSTGGAITQVGGFTVTGAANFDAGSANITLTTTGNKFGTTQFFGNVVTIVQNNDIKLVGGCVATGDADLTTNNGGISNVNAAGSNTFQAKLNLNATGTIILEDVFRIGGQLTVFSNALKDLSKLTITGPDLSGLTPVNLGTGTYVAPQP